MNFGNSCFGFSGADSNSGGTIGGGGTLNTLAMFTPDGTHIGDSTISQSASMGGLPSSISPLVSSSFQAGRDNYIYASVNAVFGYDIQSYVYGDMFFGTTIHADPAATGDFNYWLGGDFTISGNVHQNIANLYHSTVSNCSSSIFYGHFNTISDVIDSSLTGSANSFSTINTSEILAYSSTINTVTLSNIHVAQSNISYADHVGALGNNITIGGDPINPVSYVYALGYNHTSIYSNTMMIGFGLSAESINELYIGRTNLTKAIFRDDNIHWLYNGTANENKSGETTTTTDGAVPAAVTLQTIAIPTDTVVLIECYVTCRKTAGVGSGSVGDGNAYIRTVKAQNIAGVVTIGTIQSSFTSEVVTTNNVTFTVSGTDVLLRVTGSIDNTFNWNVVTDKYSVV